MDVIHSKWRKAKPKKKRKGASDADNLKLAREKLQRNKNKNATASASKKFVQPLSEKYCTRSISNNRVDVMKSKLQESATSRKLAFSEKLNSSSDVVDDQENMFINISALKVVADKLICEYCKSNSVKFEVGQRNGFAINLLFVCESCGKVCVNTSTSSRTDSSKKNSSHLINQQVVQSFTKIGLGISALQDVCASLNMHCISNTSFYHHLETVKSQAAQLKEEVLLKSRTIARQVHNSLNPDLKNETPIDILSSYDGSWHKRGFTSLFGFGCVIDVLTGLVIDYEVLSKYCHMCVITEKDLGPDSPEFDIWYQSHKKSGNCNKNYDGSSGSMELAIAEILWRRSVSDCEMRYMTMVSDGDAKTFNHLSSLNIYTDPLVKEECINHVAKRLSTALREVVKTSKVKGITLGGRSAGALTNKVIGTLAGYYRHAIVHNKNNVSEMQKQIMATLHHCSSTDQKHNHSLCPQGIRSWCFYNSAIAKGKKPHSHTSMKVILNQFVVDNILPIYKRLSNTELLTRCTQGLTQNANEAIHSVLWRKCSKNNSSREIEWKLLQLTQFLSSIWDIKVVLKFLHLFLIVR